MKIKSNQTVAELFDAIVANELSDAYKMLLEDIEITNMKDDIKKMKKLKKSFERVMEYYGVKV